MQFVCKIGAAVLGKARDVLYDYAEKLDAACEKLDGDGYAAFPWQDARGPEALVFMSSVEGVVVIDAARRADLRARYGTNFGQG